MMKRAFDIFFSLIGLILLLPLIGILAIWITMDSPGGAFYRQWRVGRNGKEFRLLKFRTMALGSDLKGLLTIGGRDPRVIPPGYFLRSSKLDELPQLFNVLKGDMSLVGPRPEVKKYVDLYTPEQRKVLEVRPGITDLASIEYSRESELLAASSDPEKFYIEEVMPAKLALNLKYIREQSLMNDVKIIFKTFEKLLK
jgi:lipopolysaccharide/colanic/teichoic acid biosynthesis glycosyltransferase